MFDRTKQFISLLGRARAGSTSTEAPEPEIQGYVDELTTTHVMGWMRNTADPTERLSFSVAIERLEGTRIIANGVADQFRSELQQLSIGDGRYGFRLDFKVPLTTMERDRLVVRSKHSSIPLELAPQIQGFVDERSVHHVAGWLRNRSDPAMRLNFDVVMHRADGDVVLAQGVADEFSSQLAQLSIGDGSYAFRVLLHGPLAEEELDQVTVRATGTDFILPVAPGLRTVFEPISHIAMDIVNNCNLRCPFCVYDYADVRTTRLMTDATFDSALRLIPYVTDGNFWLSCEHEATMHPGLTKFIERIPARWRRKVMYTTNLARPMPQSYFEFLSNSGIHHLNISLESLDPTIYEQMRKGARWGIFAKNWETLLRAFEGGTAPPKLRYNIMAYRSNLGEIPGLVRHLREERQAWQVEIRHTFDVAHIPSAFKAAEFLSEPDWTWLKDQLNAYAADEVQLIPPPEADLPAARTPPIDGVNAPRLVTRPLSLRIRWDGQLIVYGEWTGLTGMREHEQFIVTNIQHIRDPSRFFGAL